MAFRKFAADYLFTGTEMLGKSAVLITDENGKVHDIVDESRVGSGIERYNGILSPGFINCHCHLELSHMKGVVPENSGMVNFLLSVMKQRSSSQEIIQEAIAYQEQYMQQKGIVAVGDICNTAHTIDVKSSSTIFFHNFIEATGFVEALAAERFQQATDLHKIFAEEFGSCSVVPHAPYSVSDKLMTLINDAYPHSLLTIHNQESEAETDFFSYAKGDLLQLYHQLKIDVSHIAPRTESSFRIFAGKMTSDHSLIAVHNVRTTEQDVQWAILNEEQLPEMWWCFCPNANLYINGNLPDVLMFDSKGVNIVIGTDSIASNYQLNILEEIKTLQANFPDLSTEKLLSWATINGARALRISNRYGSFEKGKQPGVVIIHGGTKTSLEGTISRRVL